MNSVLIGHAYYFLYYISTTSMVLGGERPPVILFKIINL